MQRKFSLKRLCAVALIMSLLAGYSWDKMEESQALFRKIRRARLHRHRNPMIYTNPLENESLPAAPPKQPPSPAMQSALPSGDELLIRQLREMAWQPALPGAKRMLLKDILEQTESGNLEIALSHEKLEEATAKEKGVENKRLLFFFKFFNAGYLEGSAENEVAADKAHILVETHKAVLESCVHYYNLMRAIMGDYIAYQSIRQGLKQLDVNKARFTSGETTNVDVIQTKTELIRRYQGYLKAETTYQEAAMALLQHLNLPFDRWVYPGDLKFKDDRFLIPVLELLPDTLDTEKAVKLALKNRPELTEVEYRQTALDKLVQAAATAMDKSQQRILEASLQQLKIKREMAKREVEASTRQASQDYQLAQDKMALSLQELAMAETALRQVQVSQKAGFNSNKDVLDAQVSYAQAQVDHSNAIIDYNLSQIRLLFELGLIQPDILLQEKELII